ncbi:arginine--tRNA ligase [Neolewinella agarilytica]|uniref:Arginine--tRNA ligase n=1 Tax=Neolewinella agarilytica TaxID=478744 RepID=A0A1H9CX63_9BACT|nr:arginine--tRNA ligase [Neolewinella agarilytica]SEQ05193.1 arginyl-tRNA synthetase [Neolewinella agarilytica]
MEKTLPEIIEAGVKAAITDLYQADGSSQEITLQSTRREFEGEFTVVTFPLTRLARKKPDEIAEELGAYLKEKVAEIADYNVIKGFLNLVIADDYWRDFLLEAPIKEGYGSSPANGESVVVEFSSPNTNKPLHLGHVRNILLGWSSAQMLSAAGYDVKKVQIINDRGIAICKSMLAWQRFGEGATPESTGTKPDHFVGDYYVLFEQKFQAEYKAWQETAEGQEVFAKLGKEKQTPEAFFKGYAKKYFNDYSELGAAAKNMLLQWEAGDAETRALWEKMNGWVYEGFEETYQKLGVSFDKLYYESNTYVLGKDMVELGLEKGVFQKREDGSVFADLTDAKLSEKTLMRADGTSIYITQDLGTARLRYDDFGAKRMIYTVADEQNHHFATLFELLKRLEEPYANGLYHLSYGMVDLPSGRMKSREGTVVDADDLMKEVIHEARLMSQERAATSELSQEEQDEIIRQIGMSALKFHIIKVGPQKRMTFDPKESVDMQGQTGPYVQNAYVRTRAVWRKAGNPDVSLAKNYTGLAPAERELVNQLYAFPGLVKTAAESYDPSLVAMFCYDLAKSLHKFWHDHSILSAESPEAIAFRLQLCKAVGNTLQKGMGLLGIEVPERM